MGIAAERLAALPLFQSASPSMVAALARRAVEVQFPTDGVLFLAGSAPRGWYVVLDGCVRVVRGLGARQHVVHTERRGGTLGEVPLFAGGTHPATGIAAEPTRCAVFDKQSLELTMSESPEFGLLIARRLALRVTRLVDRLDERARSVRSRLAEFFLDRVAASREGTTVSLGMTQQALAEELGTVREVISRELKALVKAGVIESRGGGRFLVSDLGALRARTSDEP